MDGPICPHRNGRTFASGRGMVRGTLGRSRAHTANFPGNMGEVKWPPLANSQAILASSPTSLRGHFASTTTAFCFPSLLKRKRGAFANVSTLTALHFYLILLLIHI